MEICPSCNEKAVEKDPQFFQLCCTSCGCVVSEENFASETNTEGTTLVFSKSNEKVKFNIGKLPKHIQRHNFERIAAGKLYVLGRIIYLKSILNFNDNIEEEINELFGKMFDDENFIHCHVKNKIALAGSCTYIVLRQHDLPVMISHICNLLQCSASEFNSAYKTILELTKIRISTPSIEELVPVVLKNISFGEEQEEIYKLVLSILELAASCWLTSGRTRQPYIIASAFIAWKSLSRNRLNYAFKRFCKEKNINEHFISSRIRLNELNSALLKLAEKLPWTEENQLKIKLVPYLLKSILENSAFIYEEYTKMSDADLDFKQFRSMRRKSKNYNEETNKETFSEHFDDSEIDSYIRTDEQIRSLQNLAKKLKE